MARSITAVRVQKLLGSSWERSPVYVALADGLRLLISDGRIPAGTRLPSERDLTSTLGVSRTTVTRAYDLLRERFRHSCLNRLQLRNTLQMVDLTDQASSLIFAGELETFMKEAAVILQEAGVIRKQPDNWAAMYDASYIK